MGKVFTSKRIFCISFIFLLLLFLGCKDNDNPDQGFGEQGYIIVIIESDTILTTRIQTTQTYWNYNNFEVVSSGFQDTLILAVREFDLIRILNPIVDMDSVIVRSGDTLYLDIFRDGYTRKHFSDGLLFYEKEITNHFKIANSNSSMLDSLQKLFFYVDYNWPFEFNLEDTRYTDYPVIPVSESLENKPDVLETYVDIIFEDFHTRYEDKPSEVPLSLHELHAEIYLSAIMHYLGFLYRQKPYDFLKNALLSDVFSNYREPEHISVSFINRQINVLEQDPKKPKGLHEMLMQVYVNAGDYWADEILLEYARFQILEKLADSKNSENELNEKIESFAERYPKSKFLEELSGLRYLRQTQSDFSQSSEDSLLHRSGKAVTFPDLLNEHEGKFIFIDFWASWCAPCIKALPDIIALKKELDNPEIIFVFISIDANMSAWKNAENRFIPHGYEYSYIAPGFDGSALQKDLNILNIPRYVLFEREGELLLNQSGVSVEEISRMLGNLH